jgi:hypothetical protein
MMNQPDILLLLAREHQRQLLSLADSRPPRATPRRGSLRSGLASRLHNLADRLDPRSGQAEPAQV